MPKYQVYCAVCDRFKFMEARSYRHLMDKLKTIDVCPLGRHAHNDTNIKEVYRVVGWSSEKSLPKEELELLAGLRS